jgi:sugar lactone lactonase YvrE
MNKTPLALAMVLLLGSPAIATAGLLKWVRQGPYPPKGSCRPISFDQPNAVVVDQAGNIYVANEAGPNALQEITVGGSIRTMLDRRVEPINSGHYFGLSLAMGPTGNLYLAVMRRGTVERLNSNGTLTVIAGKPNDRELVDGSAPKARLKSPDAIAISRSGIIYVSDTRTIRRIGADGSITTVAGNPYAKNPIKVAGGYPYYADGRGSHAVFMSPNGIALDEQGDIYVADGYDGEIEGQAAALGLIRKISPGGVVSTFAGNLNDDGSDVDGTGVRASFGYLSSIAIGVHGDLYVTEQTTPSVREVDANGDVRTVLNGGESGGELNTTGLSSPNAVTVDRGGQLYVVDNVVIGTNIHLPIDWLHRIKNARLETLCEQKINKAN